MEVHCTACGQDAHDTLGNLLVAGWTQKEPTGDGSLGKRWWMCPSCVTARTDAAAGAVTQEAPAATTRKA